MKKANKNQVIIYTDGACENNPGGPGGWAFLVVGSDLDAEFQLSGGEESTTNNRMELQAIIEALNYFKSPRSIKIISDSKYAIGSCSEWLIGWKSKNWIKSDGSEVKNIDLLESLDELISFHEVSFRWVKGHSGNKYNDIVDELATNEIQFFRSSHK
jgi:ribonuclease HI